MSTIDAQVEMMKRLAMLLYVNYLEGNLCLLEDLSWMDYKSLKQSIDEADNPSIAPSIIIKSPENVLRKLLTGLSLTLSHKRGRTVATNTGPGSRL